MKYLGVHLDSKLNWKIYVDSRYQKAITSFYQVRRVTGKTWGLSPKVIRWIYTAIVRPMVAYGAAVWWPRVDQKTVSIQLDRVQRLVCLYITGDRRRSLLKCSSQRLDWYNKIKHTKQVQLELHLPLLWKLLWV